MTAAALTRAVPAPPGVRWRETVKLWAFAALRLPLVFFLRPRVREVSPERVVLTLPLSRRTRNPYRSMYFGALLTGAELAVGILAWSIGHGRCRRPMFLVRDCRAQLRQRATRPVTFTCEGGAAIAQAFDRALATSSRWQEAAVEVTATCGDGTLVATFQLTLAVRTR